MPIRQDTWNKLTDKMKALNIKEDDIKEKFVRCSGKGGQKIHKTDSCVYLKHLPTQIEVKCQKTRSREDNRYYARQRLVKNIEAVILKEKSEKQKINNTIRQQKKRRSPLSKHKMLQDKRHRAGIKKKRLPPNNED